MIITDGKGYICDSCTVLVVSINHFAKVDLFCTIP